MSTLRITSLAAALIAAASLTVGAAVPATASPALITGFGNGTGSTSAAAHQAASDDLIGNYFGCVPALGNLVYDTHGSGGWNAEVTASCKGYR